MTESTTMIPESKRRLAELCVKIGVLIVIAFFLTLIFMKMFAGKISYCKPVEKLPELNLTTVQNVPSGDSKTLVALGGYLKFSSNLESSDSQDPGDYTYLRLHLNKIALWQNANKSQTLILNMNCAKLTLTFAPEDQMVTLKSIKIELVNSKGKHVVGNCLIEQTGLVMNPSDSYFCYSKQEYFCEVTKSSAGKRRLVSLVVDALRFEINGDPKFIAKGQFSKAPKFCF